MCSVDDCILLHLVHALFLYVLPPNYYFTMSFHNGSDIIYTPRKALSPTKYSNTTYSILLIAMPAQHLEDAKKTKILYLALKNTFLLDYNAQQCYYSCLS